MSNPKTNKTDIAVMLVFFGTVFIVFLILGSLANIVRGITHPVTVTGTVISCSKREVTTRSGGKTGHRNEYDIEVSYVTETGEEKTVKFRNVGERYDEGSSYEVRLKNDWTHYIRGSSAQPMTDKKSRKVFVISVVMVLVGGGILIKSRSRPGQP